MRPICPVNEEIHRTATARRYLEHALSTLEPLNLRQFGRCRHLSGGPGVWVQQPDCTLIGAVPAFCHQSLTFVWRP